MGNIGKITTVDASGTLSVAEMEDRRQQKVEREKKQRYANADASEAERIMELSSKKEASKSRLMQRLSQRQTKKQLEVSDSDSNSDSGFKARPPVLMRMKTQ